MKKSQLTARYVAPTSYGPQSGTGFLDFISRAKNAIVGTNNFLKNSRAISKVSGVAGDLLGNDGLRQFSSFAAKHGYGRRGVAANIALANQGMPVVYPVRRGKKPGPKKGKKKAKK